jgi:hypothetical protein
MKGPVLYKPVGQFGLTLIGGRIIMFDDCVDDDILDNAVQCRCAHGVLWPSSFMLKKDNY